ncbi:hypothetical protein LA080_011428 [Diaporthe eres]|uniref:MYND-type domain-containing protein n=1 Tax=Diaporthe vaccinii TaxID=105482 RepID=A0ABR4EMR3_9PEZI|nr:hypothetical protein LA080_011428 [Diaporthe eres]
MASNLALALEPQQCPVCHIQIGLQRCRGCHIVHYCSREHQASHRSSHKHACNTMKKTWAALFDTTHKLRGSQQVDLISVMKREYKIASYAIAETTLLHFNSANAVHMALLHLSSIVRWVAPALYLRMGRDQQCYEFLKRCAIKGGRAGYHWDVTDDPFLRSTDADALESPEGLWTGHLMQSGPLIQLGHAACVLLIKLRIIIDLQHMLNASRAFEGIVPREVIEEIRGSSLLSGIVVLRKDIIYASTERTAELLLLVKRQVMLLFRTVSTYNRAFWPALVDPDSRPEGRHDAYTSGSAEEDVAIAVMHNREAWMETPGSIEAIKSLMKVA